MVTVIAKNYFAKINKISKRKALLASIMLVIAFSLLSPRQFANLWLTSDQQGYLLFKLGYIEKATTTFSNTRWQAYSFYTTEKFDQSAMLYGQYTSPHDMLAQGNAFAHARRYIKARDKYQEILQDNPNFEAAQINIAIVQEIIDDVNRLSASQREEVGSTGQDLGDEPQIGDGDERESFQLKQAETLSAEQLLLDPELNQMWLRQVQKNPARFLTSKFHQQAENKGQETITNEN
jgi:Ca-activated chloride channel homolog